MKDHLELDLTKTRKDINLMSVANQFDRRHFTKAALSTLVLPFLGCKAAQKGCPIVYPLSPNEIFRSIHNGIYEEVRRWATKKKQVTGEELIGIFLKEVRAQIKCMAYACQTSTLIKLEVYLKTGEFYKMETPLFMGNVSAFQNFEKTNAIFFPLLFVEHSDIEN